MAYNEDPTHSGSKNIKLTKALSQLIAERKWFYTDKELTERYLVLWSIEKKIMRPWILEEARKKLEKEDFQRHQGKNFGATIMAFGGQSFGVVYKGGDLDAVCFVPSFIDKSSFFQSFYKLLGESGDVTSCIKVENARVPIIKFSYNNIQIDLSLSILRYEVIPERFNPSNDKLVERLDIESLTSLSGVRDYEKIRSLTSNWENYQKLLKCVKRWTRCNCVSNSAMGYPGGIVWAIMAAYICNMFPSATLSVLVYKFFKVFSEWNWFRPVMLQELTEKHTVDIFHQWDPQIHTSDDQYEMAVITPTYPEQNASISVIKSNLNVVKERLNLGRDICESIYNEADIWDELLKPMDFFNMYKHFLMINANSEAEEYHLDWVGFIESQIRKFAEKLERETLLEKIHLYTKCYQKHLKSSWFIGLKIVKSESRLLDITSLSKEFSASAKSIAVNRGIWHEGMQLTITHIPRRQIAEYVDLLQGEAHYP